MRAIRLSVGRRAVVFGLLALAAATGCGDAGPKSYKVGGKVTFEGEPIPDGQVVFRRTTDQKEWSGVIKGGSYEVNSEEGDMKVEVIASRDIPGKFDTTSNPGFKEPVREMYIPKKYNSATTLTAKVGPGATDFPFELKK